MGIEIERKFLVRDESWRSQAHDSLYTEQAYVAVTDACGVRVRIQGDRANINFKSAGLTIERVEYEYPIPVADARHMLAHFCGTGRVSKTRHYVDYSGHRWEIDEFHGANAGLVVAEIELQDVAEAFEPPDWLGKEVSGDKRYLNSFLADHPFTTW